MDDDNANFDGLGSLIRLSGLAVPARARFVGEALVSGTLSSITFGLCSGVLGATTPIGPLAPFLIGSGVGYITGLIQHWRSSERITMLYAKRYPTILAHALFVERNIVVPSSVVEASEQAQREEGLDEESEGPYSLPLERVKSKNTLDEWIRKGGLGRLTWSILAAQGCRADVEEIQRQQRQRIIEDYQEKYPKGQIT